jgi:hypothetical protein
MGLVGFWGVFVSVLLRFFILSLHWAPPRWHESQGHSIQGAIDGKTLRQLRHSPHKSNALWWIPVTWTTFNQKSRTAKSIEEDRDQDFSRKCEFEKILQVEVADGIDGIGCALSPVMQVNQSSCRMPTTAE